MFHFLQCSSSSQMPLLPLFFFLLLLVASLEVPPSDARRLPLKLLEIGTSKEEDEGSRGGLEMEVRRRGLIGSRPPRCERVCMSCGHCEAVQVPIVPQDHNHNHKQRKRAGQEQQKHRVVSDAAAMFSVNIHGDLSNYKSLSWKCLCGGIILDP